MYGAILGDIIGSPYEFDRGNKSKDFEMFEGDAGFTDDTVMTIAVADALMETLGQSDDEIRETLVRELRELVAPLVNHLRVARLALLLQRGGDYLQQCHEPLLLPLKSTLDCMFPRFRFCILRS